MSPELVALGAAVILGVAQLVVAAQASTAQRGFKWNVSSRETAAPALSGVAGRLDRAFRNFLESFGFFVAAVVLIELTHRNSSLSAFGAQTYVGARALYVGIYAAGITVARSLAWLVSMFGIALMLYAAFFV